LWQSANTVLAQGEPGYEIDTGSLKIGDGTNGWNSLPYVYNKSDSLKGNGYEVLQSDQLVNTGNYTLGGSLVNGSQGVNVLTFSNLSSFGLYTFMWSNKSESTPFSGSGSISCFYTSELGFTGGYTTGQEVGVQVVCQGNSIILINYGESMHIHYCMIAHK
jgi:hypothetical protein